MFQKSHKVMLILLIILLTALALVIIINGSKYQNRLANMESEIPKKPTPVTNELDIEDNAEISYTDTVVDTDIELLAKTLWGEARGCSPDEQRLVVWTVLQRVDTGGWYGSTIAEVITKPRQFLGYCEQNPVISEIFALCSEEVVKWMNDEKAPLLPPYATELPYLYFDGLRGSDGRLHNYFRKEWR